MRYLRKLGIFLILLIVCGLLLLSVYNEVESATITQLNTEQMVHAHQAAKSIERFFSNYNNTLAFLAVNDHIITMDPEGRVLMQEFFVRHSVDIASITRVNKDGIILYTCPYESSIGANISSQAHVRKSINDQRVTISDVFTAVQGFRTVAFSMPVFKNGVYDGSVSILIPFEQLVQKDLESVRIVKTGYAWAISEKGTILYAPDSGIVDRSAFTVYNNSPTALSFIAEALKGRPGISSYTLEAARSGNDGPEKYQAAYFPVLIGDTHWSIVVATPEREILSSLQGFRNNLILISGILVISLFFFAYYSTRAWGIVKEEEQRRSAEAALRESERNYRSILENMQEIFYRSDKEGNLVMISPSGVVLLGYSSQEEMLGKTISSFYVYPEEREKILHAIRETGSITNFETRLKKSDGTVLTFLASSHTYTDASGNFLGIEGTLRDITERKRAQEEVLRTSEELNAAYEEMTSTAEELKQNYDELHKSQQSLEQARKKLTLLNTITFEDIQNALFSLAGYIELQKDLPMDEQAGTYLKKEKEVAEKISSTLAFARKYQDMGINPPLWQNANQVFLLAISHLDISVFLRKVELDNLELYADPLLETVFFNLIANTARHGKTATEISLRYREETDGLTLFIEDNGTGIPDADKEKIFERGSGERKGMGLFLVREILGITGISITETGTYGHGVRFEISLPKGAYRFSDRAGFR